MVSGTPDRPGIVEPHATDRMLALSRAEYGSPRDVLELTNVGVPAIADDEVLVRVRAAGVNAADPAVVRGSPRLIRLAEGLRTPRRTVIGQDLAGTVVGVGAEVTRFVPGDDVFGGGHGTFAEYAAAPEERLASKPAGLGFVDAAALPMAGLTALQGLRDAAGVKPGHRVLIIGASGGVGTYSVQIAKALGAEVTAVCSTRNVEQTRSIGADHVIDYTREDLARHRGGYDVVFDNAGSLSLIVTRRVLAEGGILVPNAGMLDHEWLASLPRMLGAVISSVFTSTRARIVAQRWNPDDLAVLLELIEKGSMTPVIDRTYPLTEAVGAVAYVGQGHARGKVVIRMPPAVEPGQHGLDPASPR